MPFKVDKYSWQNVGKMSGLPRIFSEIGGCLSAHK